MNDEPPLIPAEPMTPHKPASQMPVLLGFLAGALPWLFTMIPQKNEGGILFLIFSCFGMPVVSLIVALIPKTRRFGLGLLIATGLGWLMLGAICGGLFNRAR